ncbi:glycosyltransferase [Clostridium sp. MB05]|uniref:glycosyltransferase n=1 Tax=Clostridium sp. MB05 TaxID=3376682 RepID=UPI0039827852
MEFNREKFTKKDIKRLVEEGDIQTAKCLLEEYKDENRDDIDIYSIEGVISIIEGNNDKAREIIEKGLSIDSDNFDLLYNLAYLYKYNNENDLAINYYEKALKNAKNEKESDTVYEALKELDVEVIENNTTYETGNETREIEDELDNYKKEFKNNIQYLISQELLKEAKDMITQYEEIVKDDVEIYSIKGVIAILENNIDRAEEILKEGLFIYGENFDLNYNLAYLYELKEDHIKAYEFYSKANKYVENLQMEKEIIDILSKYSELHEIKIHNEKLEIENSIYPKVTIIIPTYNQKEYLKKAIDSCLQQDYPNLEILVGDDCSTDGTDKMMMGYYNCGRIKYIRNKTNLGAGINSQNLMEKYVSSKYGMILNHDDYLIKNDYIFKAVSFLKENPNVSFVWANCKIKNEISGKEVYTHFENKRILNGLDYFINYETTVYTHIIGSLTTVFDIEKLKLTEFGREKTKSRDTFLYLNLMLVGDVGFINECVAVYRIHKNGISLNIPIEFDYSTIKEFEKLKSYIISKKLVDEDEMETWIINRVFSYVHWRFTTLWDCGNKKQALDLLISISKKYKYSYEKIVSII